MPKETGIIFSTPLVPKVLDGTKTVTRRLRGLKEINENPDDWGYLFSVGHSEFGFINRKTDDCIVLKCPYGGVGDWLRLKETWAVRAYFADRQAADVEYQAGGFENRPCAIAEYDKWIGSQAKYNREWNSSLFMPKWASRKKMPIVSVTPVRLQAITEEDAVVEGMQPYYNYQGILKAPARGVFHVTWNILNPKYPWAGNFWAWRIEWREML